MGVNGIAWGDGCSHVENRGENRQRYVCFRLTTPIAGASASGYKGKSTGLTHFAKI
jgi:hypothetical protein